MSGVSRIAAVLASGLSFVVATAAHAEAPGPHATPIYILSFQTDDLDDQADALTLAIRSRVRESQGWSLLESPQSFETLALALECPRQPDAGCLQRVADQIHAEHYVWGKLWRKKGAPEVVAEVHLWSRSNGDVSTEISFSDNVKDASDASLRSIASRAFGGLTGSSAEGTLVVHAGSGGGSVLVDGSVKGKLEGGVGRFDVAEGPHQVSVRVSGFDAPARDATVAAGTEEDLMFDLTPSEPSFQDVAVSTARLFTVRQVLGYSAVVVGGGLLVGAGVGAAIWVSDDNKDNSDRQHVPTNDRNVCATAAGSWASYAQDECKASKEASSVSMAAWIMGIGGAVVGGIGVVLLATDHRASQPAHASSSSLAPSVEFLPSVGRREGSVAVRVTF